MPDSLDDLLAEALKEKADTKGKTLHGISEWKPTGQVMLSTIRDGVPEILGFFTELKTASLPTARRLVRMEGTPGMPFREEVTTFWPWDGEGKKFQTDTKSDWQYIDLKVDLDSDDLHSHVEKAVVVQFSRRNNSIRAVTTRSRTELSNYDNMLLVEPGVNIWPILSRKCKADIFSRLNSELEQ
jgi:hypothetical protein